MRKFLSTYFHKRFRKSILKWSEEPPFDITEKRRHKEYLRFKKIPLLSIQGEDNPLPQIIAGRHSPEQFDGDHVLPFKVLSTILGGGLGVRKHFMRKYPSGGARFPVETYIFAKKVEDLTPGIYHYNPSENALELVVESSDNLSRFIVEAYAKLADTASPLIVQTAKWNRSSTKYGEAAYQFAHLEAGHMTQNILLLATSLGYVGRPLAGFNDEVICAALDIDQVVESPIYSCLLGKEKHN